MLTGEEAKQARVVIIHPDVTVFELPWVAFTIEREKFVATSTAQPYFERVVAVISNAFELLRHTPVRMLGINNEAHFRATSIDKLHELGHMLAPKQFWAQFFKAPGLQSLTIRQDREGQVSPGYSQVTVEPSARIHPGVFIRINEHYQTKGAPESSIGASEMLAALKENWVATTRFADDIFTHISEQV
jgi:hypothetical protein